MIRYKFRTQEPQHWPPHQLRPFYPSAREEKWVHFDISARFRFPPSPLNSSLPSLIADYNPSHKLLTQL